MAAGAPSGWPAVVRAFRLLAAGESLARALSLAGVVVLSRVLGPAAFGIVTLGATLVLWAGVVVDAGTELVGLRDVSEQTRRFRWVTERILGLRLATSAIVAIGLAGGAFFFAKPGIAKDTLVLFALVLPALALNLRWMVLGVSRSRAVATGNVAAQALVLAGVLLFVHRHGDARLMPLLQTAGELVYGLLILRAVRSTFGAIRPRIDLRAWRRTLAEGTPVMINQAARAITQSFDLFAIAAVLGTPQAGMYSAAYRPALFLAVMAGLFFNAFLASYSAADPDDARELLRRALRLTLLTLVPLTIALSALARPMIDLVFGHDYTPAAPALAVLSLSVILTACGTGYGRVLLAARRQRTLLIHNLLGAFANVLANLAVIPAAGIVGAAVVTVSTEALVLALNARSCARLGLAPPTRTILRRRLTTGF